MATPEEIQAQIELDRNYDALTTRAKKEICAVCNGPLVVRWVGGAYELSCGQNYAHTGKKSCWEHPRILERNAREAAMQKDSTGMLAKYSGAIALDKTEAREILLTIWPDAPETELLKAALICKQYGLNPLMKHLYLVKYDRREKAKQVNGVWEKGKIVGEDWSIQIGIGATRMIARRSGAYSYEDDTPRLMTEAEQIKILGAVEPDKYWAITKLRAKDGAFAQGYGNWPRDTAVKGSEKGNTPQNMAGIRSERAALDKLFPEKLPAGVEVFDQGYVEAPVNVVQEQLGPQASTPLPIGPQTGEPPEAPTTFGVGVSATLPPEDDAQSRLSSGVRSQPKGATTASHGVQQGDAMPEVKNWGELAGAIANLGVIATSVIQRGGFKRWQDFADTYGLVGGFKKAWEIALSLKAEKEKAAKATKAPAPTLIKDADADEPF